MEGFDTFREARPSRVERPGMVAAQVLQNPCAYHLGDRRIRRHGFMVSRRFLRSVGYENTENSSESQ